VPQPGAYYLSWDIRVLTEHPRGAWRVLVDAVSGHLLQVIDASQYATGTAKVFDPNPIVTSGDTTLRHGSSASTINGQRAPVSVEHLDAASGGNLRLRGSFVRMQEEEAPTIADPANAGGTFDFNWDDNSFLDAMAYFHVDRLQDYIQNTLELNNAANYAIPVDPQGLSGADNSHYVPGGSGQGFIAFGGGTQPIPSSNPVPDAADAMVILHEYGHAIQDNSNPGFDNPASGVGEGWGDTLAAIYYDDKHASPSQTRGFMMSWDSEMGTGSWPGRRYDLNWLFDGPEYTSAVATDNHTAGQLWCATMFELFRKLGGDSIYASTKALARDLALRLHLMANFQVPASGATAQQMGQQIEAADNNLGGWRYANGLHHKVIYDTFRRRHLAGYPDKAVDVYINDGREGNYGSVSQNDLFTERLWLDTWWEVQDVWVKVTPYANAAAQQAGDPGDHVEPPVGSTAYLYVRVKNKGTDPAGSGQITVRTFHADPGIGLTWPDDWTPMTTPSITVPNVLPGPANRVVVGPFPWTPTVVGHECVLAVVECANDHAVTQDLAAGSHVGDGDLVPFDNNLAQRNLVPTPAKQGGKRKFTVRNPFDAPKEMELVVTGNLPEGWRWSLSDGERIALGPRERRWVEIDISRGDGAEVTNFDEPHRVQITGLIDDRPLGGMTFYLAPPSAFGRPGDTENGHHRVRGRELEELLELNVPWNECEFEGEVDIRMRFRRR
jgi:zinc metalloprotease ZmpB